MTQIAPYGTWKSPITTDLIVAGAVGLGQIALDGENVYWLEQRASEGGRNVLVKRTLDGNTTDVNPPPFNARTRVHEYGGGAFVVADGVVYFSHYADQRLYRLAPGQAPHPITPAVDLRYADGILDRHRNRLICVREDHLLSDHDAVNTIVAVKLDGDEAGGQVLVAGYDFYSSPRLSPDGTRLAWLAWNHPNMPWDSSELWVGELQADGSVGQAVKIAGGADESIFQPEWSPDGTLYFVSDRTDWWNLYRWREDRIEAMCPLDAEFGRPQWVFGLSTYGFESPERIICSYTQRGDWRLGRLDTTTGRLATIDLPYTFIGDVRVRPGQVILSVASPTESSRIIQLDPSTGSEPALNTVKGQVLATRKIEVLCRSSDVTVDAGYISLPQAIEFPTEHGLTAHGFFYPPRNKDYAAPEGEMPPLLVMSHGGPTAATTSSLSLGTQYWTSRGFAVLDVNYGGSTGYGRPYHQRLHGQWGVVDVDDCCNGARYLVKQKLVGGNRLAIRGGSAGGYTTNCALAFRTVFKAGASHFGLSELESFDQDTHKFESRYNRTLIGPYPERRDLYIERSPMHSAHRISCPVIFFQGSEDKIVPPSQSIKMYEAVRAKGLPTAYLEFEGEQHGFRKAETIQRVLGAELYFYGRVFSFVPADPIESVQISNL